MCTVGFYPEVSASPSGCVLAVIVLSISVAPTRLLLTTCYGLVMAEEMRGPATTSAL